MAQGWANGGGERNLEDKVGTAGTSSDPCTEPGRRRGFLCQPLRPCRGSQEERQRPDCSTLQYTDSSPTHIHSSFQRLPRV